MHAMKESGDHWPKAEDVGQMWAYLYRNNGVPIPSSCQPTLGKQFNEVEMDFAWVL